MKNYQTVLEQLKLKTRSEIKVALCENDTELEIDSQSFFYSLSKKLNLKLDEKDSNFLFHQIDPYSKGFVQYKHLEDYLEIYEERSFQKDESLFYTTPTLYPGVRCQDCIFEWAEYGDAGDDLSDHYVSLSRAGFLTFWRKDITKHFETTIAVFEEGSKMSSMATGLICLPQYKMVAASTTTSDIRFFYASSYKFRHAFSIVWLPSILLNMDCRDSEIVVCGDFTGRLYLLKMDPSFFRRMQRRAEHLEPEKIEFETIVKGRVPGLRYENTKKNHYSNVEKVQYVPSIRAVISCCVNTRRAMLIYFLDKKESFSFTSEGGISCFAFSVRLKSVVTGGIDNLVKIWNPRENSACSDTLAGHMSSVTHVLINDNRLLVVTADRDRCIRVWDLFHPVCLQTIKFKEVEFAAKIPFSNLYLNENSGQLIITTYLTAVVESRKIPPRLHAHPDSELIVMAAYSDIFDCVVTVGNRSSVAVWGMAECCLINEFTEAYTTTSKEGVPRVLDTYAAGLDPSKRRLITAGQNGCIKVWNFLLGICLRQFRSPFQVFSLSFVGFQIFAGGPSGQVSVYYDNGEYLVDPVHWTTPHKGPLVAMDSCGKIFLGTATSDGEIVLWVWKNADPKLCMKDSSDEEGTKDSDYPAKSIVAKRRRCSISQVLFLQTREMDTIVGNLVSCGVDGRIRFWNVLCTSKLNQCRLLSKFRAVFREGDGVICMATDRNNKILFTGDTMGYLRTFQLEDYYSSYGSARPQKPKLEHRIRYPFLRLQRLIERNHAEHSKFVGHEAELGTAPILVNCFRAHLGAIHRIEYADSRCIILTATRPGAIRLWTLSGQYLGYLGSDGSFQNPLDRSVRTKERLPEDIRIVASTLTLHVLNGGRKPYWERAMAALKRCRMGCEPGGSETLPFEWLKKEASPTKDNSEGISLQQELDKRISNPEFFSEKIQN